MIIAARNVISTGTPISLTLVEAAIALAQRHLSELPPEEISTKAFKSSTETVTEGEDEMDTDQAALALHIAKKQKVLAVLQKGALTQGSGGGHGGFQTG
eukprot:1284153-Rhodomonas_salina.1